MKMLNNLLALFFATLVSLSTQAQCIKDVQNLITSPAPCFYVGTVDFDNLDCFDPIGGPQWKYTWKIRAADDGELVAQYNGIVFQHTFSQFGGYEFCLEIEKDGNQANGAESVDCVTYTTCQLCGENKVKVDYNSCPYGAGCNIKVSASAQAENAVGLEPTASIVVTYYPNTTELLSNYAQFEVIFPGIDVEYHPETGLITVSEDLQVTYKRGCYKAAVVFKLEEGAGSHSETGGLPCTQIKLLGDEVFRCIACANQNSRCEASIVASQVTNQTGTCEIFNCSVLREGPPADNGRPDPEDAAFGAKPNPATTYLAIDLPKGELGDRQIFLFDARGRAVFQKAVDSQTVYAPIDISSVSPGIYFLVVREAGKQVFSQRVLVTGE